MGGVAAQIEHRKESLTSANCVYFTPHIDIIVFIGLVSVLLYRFITILVSTIVTI